MGRLDGKVAIITGGASGIGEASARLFVEEGASVLIADVQDDKGWKLAEGLGIRAEYLHADVSRESDIKALVSRAVEAHDRLDCMFNNAGIAGPTGPIESVNVKGFDEAIMLSHDGYVAQGSGENIFLVINGKLVTPPTWNNILPGITRDCVTTLAKNELGIETLERPVDRLELFLADEVFLTGTAAHVTPVAEIDHRQVGDGEIGKITTQLQQIYADVIRGENAKYADWCTPVYKK